MKPETYLYTCGSDVLSAALLVALRSDEGYLEIIHKMLKSAFLVRYAKGK